MGEAGKPAADFDFSNPGPTRPGNGIYGRQQLRAKGGILGMIMGSLLSERQQEIYYYVLFVVTFSVAWFIDRPGQHSFFLANRIGHRFLSPTFRPDLVGVDHDYERRVAWEDVSSIEDIWGWMEGPLLATLYDEDTPRSGVGNILGYAGLCNGIRVRQVRVKPVKCENMPAWAASAIMQEGGFQGMCYPGADIWNEDVENFGSNASVPLFTWTKGSKWAMSTSTVFGSYSGSGYVFDLPSFNKTRAREIIRFHRNNKFLDVQTRAIFIDGTFYHPYMERFVTMRLQAEVPESGGVETSSLFIAARIQSYPGSFGMVQLLIEAVFVIQLCGFCFLEVMQLRKLGIEYIKRFWGMVMFTKGVLMLCLIGFRVTTFQMLEKQRQEWDDGLDASEYIDMQHVARIIAMDDNVMAVMSILIYARLFKYGGETKSIKHLYHVIYKSMAEIIPFLVLFCIVYIGFALAFYSCFGLRVYEYRNLEATMKSNVAILAGEGGTFYHDLVIANKNMAPFLYYSLILSHSILLLNMFTAIIVQNMAIVKAALDKDTDVVFAEALQRGINRFKKAPMKKNKIKDGYSSEKAKVKAGDSTHQGSSGAGKDNLFERAPSISGFSTFRSGRSGGTSNRGEGDANPTLSRPTSGKSQKSGRWDTLRNVIKKTNSSGSQAGSEAGDDFDAPMTARSGRSRVSAKGGGGGLDSAALADLESEMQEIKRHVVVIDDVKMQLMAVSDRLNALTEYLVSDTTASKATRQFQTLNRKMDMLAEALVAEQLQEKIKASQDASLNMSASDILGPGMTFQVQDASLSLEASDPARTASKTAGGAHIPGWTD